MEGWGGLWAEPSAFIERGFGQPVAERRGGSVCERSEHDGGGFAAQQHFGSTHCTGGVSGVADLPMLCRLWLISGNALENRLRVGKGAAGDVYLRVDLEGSFWTLYEFMSCGF